MFFGLKKPPPEDNDGPPVPEYTRYILRTECFPGCTDAEIDKMDSYVVMAALIVRNAIVRHRNELGMPNA